MTSSTLPSVINYSANYHLWTFDLKTKTAKIADGVDYKGGQYVLFKIDGRAFVAIPAGDYSKTEIFEMVDGAIVKRFDVQAWMFNMFRVR